MSSPRKRTTLTVQKKLKVIKLYEEKGDLRYIMTKFGVEPRLVKSWVALKDQLQAAYDVNPLKTKVLQRSEEHDETFVKDVIAWIAQERERGIKISQKHLQVHAEQMRMERGLLSEITKGWVRHFLKKHNVQLQ